MKKVLFALALAVLMCGAALAEADPYSHGSAVVPMVLAHFNGNTAYDSTSLYLSNITESEVECTIRYYDYEGNEIGSQADIYTGSQNSGSGVLVSTGATFTIPANSSRSADFHEATPRMLMGYVVVEWQCSNVKVTKALVGGVRYYGRGGSGTFDAGYVLINSGQPF